ncbi:tyrosine-protein phosphatase [Streptomyces sp. ID05-39B]|uniref:tyrosine-protein phosphatase n=1 Tax=Streptomyces sp. ID05-39B TaxID=3028664 RepID=UPI0029A5BF58|nr:tyrosine-protein phosphatase [Streptomyces sp. ID05-39B]MDX3526495.1 tyrosine-protein phosphatase [Streptomyces sp. ID05-39B]
MDRHLSFEALHNFRDLGGHTTPDGRHRVRPGRLFLLEPAHRRMTMPHISPQRRGPGHPARTPRARHQPPGRAAQPFTQMNCFSFATTSTRSRCWSMTCSIGL